ncbi:MAG: hypothetical protein GC168_02120 [Candidatus Hydrogenedens sp.]|nr:hypothetical protein [Candidatus Hydrogenedens sp.]
MRDKGVGRNLAALALGLAVAALLLEAGSRWIRSVEAPAHTEAPITFAPVGEAPPQAVDGDLNSIHILDDWTWWRVKPDLHDYHIAIPWTQRDFVLNTDAHGFRRTGDDHAGVPLRVFAAGDSTTFGVGVNDDETWPAQLEALLPEGSEVVNAGVPGFTSFQSVRMAEMHGAEPRPDVVVICAGFNDPAQTPPGELPDLKRAAQADADADRPASAFLALVADAVAGAQPKAPEDQPPRISREDYVETLEAAEAYFAERGIPLVWIRWPTQREVERDQAPSGGYPDLLLEHCCQPGVRCVDLMPTFKALPESPYFDFVHATAEGNAAAAKVIAESLRLSGLAE